MPGAQPPAQPPSAFEVLSAAVASRKLTGAQAAALIAILGELAIWDSLESRAATERPEHGGDPVARRGYLLGLSERTLTTFRAELVRLTAPPRPSPSPKAY